MRDEMVEGGSRKTPRAGSGACGVVDDERVVLVRLDGGYRIEIGWDEWAK
jgi:hypothetical protein